ncbi:MAG: hypothetical protein HGB04_06495 [Chlorobiaceae bacterium]|nr:hypothetical protein [Chlorobiaceae bacterium]
MAGLFLGGSSTVNVGTRYNGLGLQSSQQGLPVPIIYGTVKTAGNLIWYGDFKSQEHREHTGGKGGGGTTVVSYTYTCAVAIGIGEGVVGGYGTVWQTSGTTSVSALNLSAFYGAEDQGAWSYLTTHHPDQALNYPSTAYLASGSFDLGSYNALPQMWFKVSGLLNGTGVIGDAADPALMIKDFLTNSRYGCNFSADFIDDDSLLTAPNSYARYCGVNGIAFAAIINERKQAREYVSEWLEATNTAPFWSGDKLKFVPFGDKPMTGHTYAYDPELIIRYELTEEDILHEEGEEPIEVTRADPYDCYNHVKLQVRDQNNEYNTAVCEVKDQASIELIGLRTRDQLSAEFIPSPTAGMMAAELIKNRGLYIRNQYRFRLSWEYALLEPMDLVSLTLEDLGLNGKPVRVMEINEDSVGRLEILAEEFLEGSQWSVQYPPQGGTGYVGNIMVDPGDVNAPVIFEPLSAQLGSTNPQVWIAVTGNTSTWGGSRLWISTDGGDNYSVAGIAESGGITGVLTAGLAAGGSTLSVDLGECGGVLASVTADEAALGRTAMVIGGEVLAYTTATMTGPSRYNLTGLVRGLYSTAVAAHSTGAKLGYLASTVYRYTIPNPSYYGTTVKLKFTSYNIYGAAQQGLDTVTEYSYTITGVGGGGGEYAQTLVTGVNQNAALSYSTSAYASKGNGFLIGSREVTIKSVSVFIDADASAKYKCVVASVNKSGTSAPITAILGTSDETAMSSTTAGAKTFHFSSGVGVAAGICVAVIIVRVDGTSTSICKVSYPGAVDQGLTSGDDFTYSFCIRAADKDPAVGEEVYYANTSAVAMGILYLT